MADIHQKYMKRCIQLAKNGLGTTYPNPLVGSVIISDHKIIGEGWHYKSGLPHAEANAISSVSNPGELKGATLYVNLEPCSHYGKTPPCAQLIIDSGIKKVVVGSLDPNPQVAGRGIQMLKDAGCEVITGIMEDTCDELNKRFFTFHIKKRPYIILKWAQTADNFIAPDSQKRTEQAPVWITNIHSRQRVHKLRAEEDAILVGTNTVMADNPTLTTRDYSGKNPIRLVLDRELKLDQQLNVFNEEAKTIVFTEKDSVTVDSENVMFKYVDFSKSVVSQICDVLYKEKIQSVIVEGGAFTLKSFIEEGIWDEAFVFTAPITFEDGVLAPNLVGKLYHKEEIKDNSLFVYRNSK